MTFKPPSLTEITVTPDLYDAVRIYAMSDLHVDYRKNLELFQYWCSRPASGNSLSSLALEQEKSDRIYSILLIPGTVDMNI